MKKINWLNVALCVAIAVVILPTMYTILFSWPIADDFSMAIGVDKKTVLLDAIQIANDYYINHAGGWIWIFTEVLFNPLVYASVDSYLLGFELLAFFCCFMLTIWMFIRTIFKYVFQYENLSHRLVIFLLFFLCLLNLEVYKEIFYWYIGAIYLIGVMCIVWVWILEIKYFINPNKKSAILLTIVGTIGCSNWSMAVYPCFIFFCYIISDMFYLKRKRKKTYIPFVFMIVSTLVALFAPGNFVRRNAIDSTGFHFAEAFSDTMAPFDLGLMYLFKNPFFILLMIAMLLYGYQLVTKFKFTFAIPAWPFGVAIAFLFVQYYIVVLGNSDSNIPNRMTFIFNFFAIMLFGASVIYLGAWLRTKINMELQKRDIMMLALVGLLFIHTTIVINDRYMTLPWKYTVESIDIIKVTRRKNIELYKAIEESPDEDVVIYYERIPDIILKKIGLTNDPTYWVNESVADYFGKDSVTIFWTDYLGG